MPLPNTRAPRRGRAMTLLWAIAGAACIVAALAVWELSR